MIPTSRPLIYDHSWSLDFPRSLYSLSEENSARGYLAKLPMDRASARNRDGPENIWLIDKGVLWMRNPQHYYWTSDAEQLQEVSGPKLDIATVYRDCDAEYVEVSWEHSAPRNADAIYPSSRAFITKLGMQLWESDFVALPPSTQMRSSSPKKDSATLARCSV
ncbi:hypothetical protein DER46DRAFT_629952 [Fusarium sp. MPI-SDFR-AT-0072]|nr:hypothetical protein DER46DRAFT_629952 [Fusarium sp. MPI-SDFR-AT-0072]